MLLPCIDFTVRTAARGRAGGGLAALRRIGPSCCFELGDEGQVVVCDVKSFARERA